MWVIIPALFGLIYWGIRLSSDAVKSYQWDVRNKSRKAAMYAWDARVTNEAMEVAIRKYIGQPGFLDQAEEALSIIRTLPHLENAKFTYRRDGKTDVYINGIVFYIQMVKRGKLPSLFTDAVIYYLGLALDTPLEDDTKLAFALWVESTLQKWGISDAALYYEDEAVLRPSFTWEPYVHTKSALRITEPNIEARMRLSRFPRHAYPKQG